MAVQLGSEWSPGTYLGSPCMSCGSKVWASCLSAQLPGPLGERVGKARSAWYTWIPTEPVEEAHGVWRHAERGPGGCEDPPPASPSVHRLCRPLYTPGTSGENPLPTASLICVPVSTPCCPVSILSPFLCLEVLGGRVQWGSCGNVPPPALRGASWFPRVPG